MKPFVLLDGLRGIYVPKKFAQLEGISGIPAEDLAILRAGPDHESYWEAWEEALRFWVMERRTVYAATGRPDSYKLIASGGDSGALRAAGF